MNQKKIKIMLCLPILLIFIAVILYSAAPARAAPNDTMPKIIMPDPQIKIPGLNLSTGEEILSKCTKDGKGNLATCSFGWIGEYIAAIYKYAIGIVGILAAVVLMIGGVMWIVAGGSATAIGEAKAWIGASLTGLIIALTSYAILYQVNPALLNYSGLAVGMVKPPIEGEPLAKTSGGGMYTIGNDITTYNSLLIEAAGTYGVDCRLLKAVMLTESSGKADAESEKGALGLMQLMPGTAADLNFSVSQLKNPRLNIRAGANYLAKLKNTGCNGKSKNDACDMFGNNSLDYLLAAYNGGPGANKQSTDFPADCVKQTWWQCTKNTGYQQTRNYVEKVKANNQKIIDNNWGCL
ncbi:MAG: transglycosylase SLT domain-containing protein [bacterium]|nr:transglycosylase SLT domain-containing protein [bacterium]